MDMKLFILLNAIVDISMEKEKMIFNDTNYQIGELCEDKENGLWRYYDSVGIPILESHYSDCNLKGSQILYYNDWTFK